MLGKSYPENEKYDVLIFASRQIIDVKIPDTVEIIESYSFQYNTQIESFILPPNIKRINKKAFNYSFKFNASVFRKRNNEKHTNKELYYSKSCQVL